MREARVGVVCDNKVKSMNVSALQWWELDRLLTDKDREEIHRAWLTRWEDIDASRAETEAGRYRISEIISKKRHRDEYDAGML